jgi:DNA recombination protein RmuC
MLVYTRIPKERKAKNMGLDGLSVMIGLVAGAVLGLGVAGFALFKMMTRSARLEAELNATTQGANRAQDEFRLLAQQVLQESQQQFLVLAGEKLKTAQAEGSHDLEKRQSAISEMVKPLQKHLETLGSTVEQIKGTDQALKDELRTLARETARLSGALRDPTAQGRWGEYILETLLDSAGLIKGVHYLTQDTIAATGHRPDIVLNMPDGLKIVIDAKTPINEFANTLGTAHSEEELERMMKDLAAQVRTHIIALSRKGYWENIDAETVDFTVLFLPSEPLFSMALRGDPGLVDLAMQKNIVLASPTLMMALVRVVRMGWRQVDLANNAREISDAGSALYQRLSKFADHLDKVGRGLSGALNGYNDAVGSMERMVLPAARKLQELGVQDGGKKTPDLKMVEEPVRRLTGTDHSV